jgi:16S rRNA (guanine(1405)-N(7))-methyltransferase
VVEAEAVAAVVAELQGSRKYATLHEDLLGRTASWALERSPSRKEASKAARRKLHQIHGAYLPAAGIADAERAAQLLAGGDLETACRAVLAAHTSTRERLEVMPEFFAAAFGPLTGPVRVADLGAGLNPFAIPWMPLDPGSTYLAIDVDERIERLVERLTPYLPFELVARTEDLASATEPLAADVALLLKVLSPLEHQSPAAAAGLLARVSAGRIVITVPAHSLGARKRGMRQNADAPLTRLFPGFEQRAERHDFTSETMFVLAGPR